jgi:adenosylmethionine-8-amino-7-oxononanoate aminotransferase
MTEMEPFASPEPDDDLAAAERARRGDAHRSPLIAPGAASATSRSNAELQRADRRVMWHPFTQQQGWMGEDFPVIVSAYGCWLIDADGRRYLDGVSSLWCAVHGHRVPEIDAAVRAQLERVGHSTLLGLSGEPAVALAEELVHVAPAGLSRVFYSDSGSTAVEVALKMAFQHWRHVEGPETKRTRFVSLKGAYHGDTIGSVSVGGIDLFHGAFGPLLFDVVHTPVPVGHTAADRVADTERCLNEFASILDTSRDSFAALVIEPGVQGASGIRTYPEGFTAELVEMARRDGLLVIVDEVATGFGRSGELFACEQEDILPDLLCLAKALSGGYLPLAATLATERVYEAFHGEHEELKTFFHGHTFTGNALACAAAQAGLELCRRPAFLPRARFLGDRIASGLHAGLDDDTHVLEIRRYGSMFGIELVAHRGHDDEHGRRVEVEAFPMERRTGHLAALAARERGVIVRPLGDTVVIMPPLALSDDEADILVDVTVAAIKEAVSGP